MTLYSEIEKKKEIQFSLKQLFFFFFFLNKMSRLPAVKQNMKGRNSVRLVSRAFKITLTKQLKSLMVSLTRSIYKATLQDRHEMLTPTHIYYGQICSEFRHTKIGIILDDRSRCVYIYIYIYIYIIWLTFTACQYTVLS